MGQLIAPASLHGYIVGDDNTIGQLFDWLRSRTAGTIARQCRELRLLDAVAVDLVPVMMAAGRPYVGEVLSGDVVLGAPTVCIQGDRVTYLVFPAPDQSSGARG